MQDMSHTASDLTPGEVARIAGVTSATVRRWARSGLLVGVKRPGMKGQYRFHRADVDRFLDSLKVGQP